MGQDFLSNFAVTQGMVFSKGIVLLEDCEGTFKWIPGGLGADYVCEFSPDAAYFGTHGLQIKTRTAGTAVDDWIRADRYVPISASGLAVMRCFCGIPDVSVLKSISFGGYYYRDDEFVQCLVKYSPNVPVLEYFTNGGYVEISGYDQVAFDGMWFTWEQVLDINTKKLIEVTFNGIRKEVNAEVKNSVDATGLRYSYLGYNIYTEGAAPAEVYIDAIYIGEFLTM